MIVWLVPGIILFGIAPTFIILWFIIKVVTCFLPVHAYIFLDDKLYSVYQRSVLLFYETFARTKIILHGDHDSLKKGKENVLYIANHQSAVDWIICDMLAVRQGGIGRLRYMLKEELKFTPLYGFYFYQHSCIYVNRSNFKENKAVTQLQYLKEKKVPCWLVIYPEGTRVVLEKASLLDKSRQFAENQGLPPLQHHLTPRSRGTELSLAHLGDYLDAVYDVTVVYRELGGDPSIRSLPGMYDWFSKRRAIHIYLNRISMCEVPREKAAIKTWLHSRFILKDKLFTELLSGGAQAAEKADKDGVESPLSFWETVPACCFLVGLTYMLNCHVLGRCLYSAAAVLGTLIGIIYAAICI